MKSHAYRKHRIDTVFPITLFFVMTLFAVMVITLAAGIYKNTTEKSHRNHQSRIALSYISEKIHQNEENCIISVDNFEGLDTLTLKQTYENTTYYTYIYFYEGALRELFAREDVDVSLSDGKIILELYSFSMEEIADGLLYFSCVDSKDQTADSYVSIKN